MPMHVTNQQRKEWAKFVSSHALVGPGAPPTTAQEGQQLVDRPVVEPVPKHPRA
jgi:hypothetical protein